MSQQTNILIKEKHEQFRLLANALDPFVNGLTVQTDPVITEEDLDRIAAFSEDLKVVANLDTNKNISMCAAVLQNIHESHRTRRDLTRINKTHKDLILDSLTLANKKRKIFEQVTQK